MNAPNVRSVTVRLDAAVAKYIADIKMAGRATEESFDKAHASIGRVNADLEGTNTRLREYRTRSAQAARDTDRLADSMGRLNSNTRLVSPAMRDVDRSTTLVATRLDRTGNAIDRTSGRLALLAKTAALVGPGLIPTGAVGVAGIAGLASQLGFAAAGITSLVVASRGLGDALKAVETARLDPTVKNLQAARDAMRGLAPEARAFVERLQDLRPVFLNIRNQAAAGWFPGLTEALDHFEDVAPRIGRIFKTIGEAGGDLVADAAEALAGPEWAEFLTFIKQEAPGALEDLGHTAGNLVHGMAELWMAFSPVNNDFSDWLLDVSAGFDDWAANLAKTEGFREFVDYLSTNGPKLADAGIAISDAFIQIVEAAAPLGGPVLEWITNVANALATIADSPLGTPLAATITALSGISLVARGASGALNAATGGLSAIGIQAPRTTTALRGLVSIGGRLSLVATGIAAISEAILNLQRDDTSVSDLVRNLDAIAQGQSNKTAEQLVEDIDTLGQYENALTSTAEKAQDVAQTTLTLGFFDDTALDKAEASISAIDEALATMVESGNVDQAVAIFDALMERILLAGGDQTLFLDQLGSFNTAMANQRASAGDAAGANDRYSDSLGQTGDAADAARAEITGLVDAMLEQRQIAIGAFDAVTRYREALKEARIQGRKTNEGIEGNSKAALENRHILADLASAWLNQSHEIRNNVSKQREARRSFIETATAMGVPIEKARELARELLAIPRQRVVDIDVKNAQAMAAITAARSALNTLPRNIPINIHVSRTGIDAGSGLQFLSGRGQADGGTVPGPRQPYGDKVLSLLAPGEEVITNRNGEADRFRADRAAGRIPAYADGTTRVITRRGDSEVEREARRTAQGLKNLTGGLKEAEKAVERERRQRDALVERMDQIRSGLAGGLTTGLGGENNPWASQYGGATLGGNLATIRSDTAEAQRTRRLIRILREKGFDGKALEDLLSRGDTNEIADFASSSRRDLREYEKAFNERARYVRVTSRLGADAALGDRLDEANKRLHHLEQLAHEANQDRKQGNRDRKDEHEKDRDNERRGRGDERRDGRGTR